MVCTLPKTGNSSKIYSGFCFVDMLCNLRMECDLININGGNVDAAIVLPAYDKAVPSVASTSGQTAHGRMKIALYLITLLCLRVIF